MKPARKIKIIGVIGILLLGAPLHAQTPWGFAQGMAGLASTSPALQAFLNHSSERGASPEFVQGVVSQAQSLQSRGIPAEPFLNKASEGLVKGVAPGKIQPALRQTQQRLETADQLVERAISRGAVVPSPWARQAAVNQYQRALWVGVSPSELERLGPAAGGRSWGIQTFGTAAQTLGLRTYSNQPWGRKGPGMGVPSGEIPSGIPQKGTLKVKIDKSGGPGGEFKAQGPKAKPGKGPQGKPPGSNGGKGKGKNK